MQAKHSRDKQPVDTKVRAKRVGVETGIVAETRTIGAPLAFVLATENLSRTGFLLRGNPNTKIPYQINTLIEMTLDPRGSHLERPVHLLGRVVRTLNSDDTGRQFGIHIVQMDSRDAQSFEKFVQRLESQGPALPAAS